MRMYDLRDDGGSVAVMVPFLAMAILLLGGLVETASLQLNARGRAVAYAEEAARVGASAVDLTKPDLVLDREVALLRAESFCENEVLEEGRSACTGPIVVRGTDQEPDVDVVVEVEVEVKVPAGLLSMLGVETLTASGRGSARPYEGSTVDEAVDG